MAFNKITLYDSQSLDYLVLLSHIATTSDVDLVKTSNYIPNWASFNDMEIFAPFTENLVSSYINGLTSALVGFEIYRQKKDETILHKVATVGINNVFVIDYMTLNRKDYRWTIIPITEQEVGVSLMTDYTTIDCDSWSVTSLNKLSDGVYVADETWIFSMALGSPITPNAMVQNLDITQNATLSRYPKVSVGASNYISSNISCLIGNVDCSTGKYTEPSDKIEAWRKFVANGKPCLLKDNRGQAIICKIFDPSDQYDNSIHELPTTISFSYVETFDIENVSVYSEV